MVAGDGDPVAEPFMFYFVILVSACSTLGHQEFCSIIITESPKKPCTLLSVVDRSPDFLIYQAHPIKEIDRCWEAEWRPPWMLCYTVARLADKRTSNLTVLLTRPRPLLAFRGAQGGKQRASLCLLRPKGRWGWVCGWVVLGWELLCEESKWLACFHSCLWFDGYQGEVAFFC